MNSLTRCKDIYDYYLIFTFRTSKKFNFDIKLFYVQLSLVII